MKKLILFGDSITAGFFDDYITTMFTTKLQEKLPELQIINVGIPGDDTNGALDRVQKHVIKRQPDFVLIFFGSNDAATDSHVPIERYQKNLDTIIQQVGSEKVILVTPALANQMVQEKIRPNETLMAYAQVVRALAEKHHTYLVDLQQKMSENPQYNAYFQPDGFHFSEAGYDLLVKEVTDTFHKIITA